MRLSAPERPDGPASSPDAPQRVIWVIWAALAAVALWFWLPAPVAAQAGDYRTVGSTAAYLGVMPAELIQGHAPDRPEGRMHGGPPEDRHAEHIVVALFDTQSGARLEDATVSATIAGHGGLNPIEIDLEPMRTAGVITYGGFVSFPGEGDYTIEILVRRPGNPPPARITFDYKHGPG